MPYADPDRQRLASRESKRRARARAASERTERVLADVEAGVFRALPDPPTRDELLRLLGAAARGGSVRAIELLLRFQPGDTQGDQLSHLLAEHGEWRARQRWPTVKPGSGGPR